MTEVHVQANPPVQPATKRIPYATADYGRLRRDNAYYVDKTRFIPLLEAAPYYLFCIRPRRFGKSLWLSLLQHYYDVNRKEEFAALFGDTYIGAHPTPERNSYLIMFFNFALVNPAIDAVQQSFEENGQLVVTIFLDRYQSYFSAEERQDVLRLPNTEGRLRHLFYLCDKKGLKTYLLIDEYDNFANTILSNEGQAAYHQLTHGSGFLRYFFNLLKGATGGQLSGLTRLFITGVSPVTMDDVSSGFNIGTNISLDARFNEMIGFTEQEVRAMLTYYFEAGDLPLAVEETMTLMQEWYNNYRFAKTATSPMFNSDMVLYFILHASSQQRIPEYLIDPNVRIDYLKLRHLILLNQRLNGNFSQLKEIIETGETTAAIQQSFPLERLLDRENFISLLYFLGLLTVDGESLGKTRLRIPNLTIKHLMYNYIREAFQDVDIFRIDVWRFSNLLGRMAYYGEWQPVFDFLAEQTRQQTSIRDYLSREKVIQGFLLAYLNIADYFLIWSEKEVGGGFADFYLEPFLAQYPNMHFGYLVELEYIARNEFNDDKLQEKIKEAKKQLAQYANDPRLQKIAGKVTIKPIILIYNGWELAYRAEA